jgi:hypothetical protein
MTEQPDPSAVAAPDLLDVSQSLTDLRPGLTQAFQLRDMSMKGGYPMVDELITLVWPSFIKIHWKPPHQHLVFSLILAGSGRAAVAKLAAVNEPTELPA